MSNRCQESGIRKIRIRGFRWLVGANLPIEVIDDDGQIALAARHLELRNIGETFLIGSIGMEVTLHLIAWMGVDLTFVRAVGALLLVA